ncbi:hypothetical protein DL98DRAFT_112186 [Cadophora sp. DSE1049]|nr:hypothetical protein DL98DRAFT_112186 [Cadophora sp. DSE1049]
MARGKGRRTISPERRELSHLDGNQAKLTTASSYLYLNVEAPLLVFVVLIIHSPGSTSQSEVRDEVPAFCTIRIRPAPAISQLYIERSSWHNQPALQDINRSWAKETLNVSASDARYHQLSRLGCLHLETVNYITQVQEFRTLATDRRDRPLFNQDSINSTYTSCVHVLILAESCERVVCEILQRCRVGVIREVMVLIIVPKEKKRLSIFLDLFLHGWLRLMEAWKRKKCSGSSSEPKTLISGQLGIR